LLTPRPSSPWTARAGSGPRHMRFSTCGRFVYLLNELDATLDVVVWHAETAQLQHLQTMSTLPPGFDAKPWAADIHLTPDGRCLISSERSSSTLAVFHVDTDTGLLTLAGHTSTEAQPRGFAIHDNGQHVLVAGQQSHHVSCYRLDTSSGTLVFQQRVPTGKEPNWIEIVV
jgi:6-phosphogluconolactonase